jgi:hypothetical protein
VTAEFLPWVLDEGIVMKTATGLTLVAIGAIRAFAVTAHPHFLNLQIMGWVILVIGLIGLFMPRSGYGWVRSRVVVRRRPRRALAAPEAHVVTDDVRRPAAETVEEYYEE